MPDDPPEPMETFEAWLLRYVSRDIEAGEVSADLPTELQVEFEATRKAPQWEGHAAAVRQIAELAGIPEDQAAETQRDGMRELLMRRIADAWLEA